jgi:predicted RNase H-like nuclease
VPIDLSSHPGTSALVEQRSLSSSVAYKQREDLLDAAICVWTAALWHRYGMDRCQVLGVPADGPGGPVASIIAPARPEQRV